MRKCEVLAEFKKTVKLCLKHIECGFNDYTYVLKYNHIHYDDNYDITHINIKDGIYGYMISIINIDDSNSVPSEVHGSDTLCSYFWNLIDEGNFVEGKVARDYRDVVKYVGKGATIEDAVVDLYHKMKDGGEKFF